MLRIEAFDSSHLSGVRAHPKQSHYQYLIDDGIIASGFTGFWGDEIIGFGGLLNTVDGTVAWVLFTDAMTPERFLPVYRYFERNAPGLLMDVDPDYPEAVRMADMLGFQPFGAIGGLQRMAHV